MGLSSYERKELPGVVEELPVLARWWIPGVHEGGKMWQKVHAWLGLRRRHCVLVLDFSSPPWSSYFIHEKL